MSTGFSSLLNCVFFGLAFTVDKLPKTNSSPCENGCLEDDRLLLGPGLFSGAFIVSFRDKLPPGPSNRFGVGVKNPQPVRVKKHHPLEGAGRITICLK